MNRFAAALIALAAAPALAVADDFPTKDKVEYVLECMSQHPGRQEYLYKCSCAVDEIAAKIKYDDYVTMSTASRYQSLGGERGGVFRDPEDVRGMSKKYREIEAAAKKSCLFQ